MRFRAKSLTTLLFAFLLALPMISVISKVIYVQSNKNAYESYYGETINERTLDQINYNNLKSNETYVWNSNNFTYEYNDTLVLYIEDAIFNNITYNVNSMRLQCDTNNNINYMFLYNNSTYVKEFNLNATNVFGEFTFNYKGNTATNNIYNYFYQYNYNKYSYLDNVFEYAVDEVIKENNFGNIDFFSYFTSIFMSDNQVNNRYIGYVNYYLNYALMVSLAYLLFLMLMWFVNFARRFLDRGMNYDW